MALGFTKVLLADERGGDQGWFCGVRLVLVDLLGGGEGAFERGGEDGVDVDGAEVFASSFGLLYVREVSEGIHA